MSEKPVKLPAPVINEAYERFLVARNIYDGQIGLVPNSFDLLDCTVRRNIGEYGAARTAGRLYALADLLAVRGIVPADDFQAAKPSKIEQLAAAVKESEPRPVVPPKPDPLAKALQRATFLNGVGWGVLAGYVLAVALGALT